MLSFDRSEHRADHRRRPAGRAYAPQWEEAQPFDPHTPWDDQAAEALMCLFESEEGRLSRPAAGNRVRPSLSHSVDREPEPADGSDRAWLEAHLSRMAERLQEALAQASPEPTLAALSGQLETIEQRFGATLGRVAQRADLDGLRSIETRVLDLTSQLEQTRDRLDRISAVDDEVRALARKVEEAAGAQRTSGLEKLLRDCIAEWREGEQRTASALQHIEEAIGRLGETVDAMEASKPAPDLTVSALAGTELGRVAGANSDLIHAENRLIPSAPPSLYQPALDAADYAPKPLAAEAPAPFEPSLPAAEAGAQPDVMTWSADTAGIGQRSAGAKLTPGALRIMALRAKLRQSNGSSRASIPSYMAAGVMGESRQSAIKRASLSVLLMTGAALVASSTFYLYQTFVVSAPASPAMVAPAASPAGVRSDLADPVKGAS
jgi:hypothetical protein